MPYATAKNVLNAQDINRIACVALNAQISNIDFDKAAAEFGAASANSMRVMYNAALRKIRDAEAADNGDAVQPEAATPKAKKSSPKKRKSAEDDGGAVKKPRVKKIKSTKTSQDAENEGEDEEVIKPEVEDDDLYA